MLQNECAKHFAVFFYKKNKKAGLARKMMRDFILFILLYLSSYGGQTQFLIDPICNRRAYIYNAYIQLITLLSLWLLFMH